LCNKAEEVKAIEDKEHENEISWILADYLKAQLFTGLKLSELKDRFNDHIQVINNLDVVLSELRQQGFKTLLITAGPTQVAEMLSNIYCFDRVYGSEYEVVDDCFTGKITKHLGDNGKVEKLIEFCADNHISLEEAISVGDGESDIKLFEQTGKSIAINYSKSVIGKADKYIETEDLKGILEFIFNV
jgi:phosphoserine phosphatase